MVYALGAKNILKVFSQKANEVHNSICAPRTSEFSCRNCANSKFSRAYFFVKTLITFYDLIQIKV